MLLQNPQQYLIRKKGKPVTNNKVDICHNSPILRDMCQIILTDGAELRAIHNNLIVQ